MHVEHSCISPNIRPAHADMGYNFAHIYFHSHISIDYYLSSLYRCSAQQHADDISLTQMIRCISAYTHTWRTPSKHDARTIRELLIIVIKRTTIRHRCFTFFLCYEIHCIC